MTALYIIFRFTWLYLSDRHRIKIAFVSFLFFNTLHVSGQHRLTITDCSSGEPISDIIITNEHKRTPLGYTNQNGAEWKRGEVSKTLNFKKLGSVDTSVVISPRQTNLCLYQKVNELEHVEIEGKRIPLHKQFEQFIEKTVSVLPAEDDSLYYSFQYTMEVPDSGWICHFAGEVVIPTNSYKRAYGGAFGGHYCTLRIKVNPDFYHSEWFAKLNRIQISQYYLSYDLIRKRYPYRKRIKEEMVAGKISLGDSTLFYVEGYGGNRKYYFRSRPIFNADSILIQNNVTYEQYDIGYGIDNSTLTVLEESIMIYQLENELRIESLEVDGDYTWNGVKYKIQFQTRLLDKTSETCTDISFFTHLNEDFFAERPDIEVEFIDE